MAGTLGALAAIAVAVPQSASAFPSGCWSTGYANFAVSQCEDRWTGGSHRVSITCSNGGPRGFGTVGAWAAWNAASAAQYRAGWWLTNHWYTPRDR
ncbi:hypothetical protein ACIPY6_25885 [Streptomyces sp. NPDC090054]|uniref:hypothetical protein n=1 Tax=Streptomyces sp. NPDC090054 TaxID=3365933 RepID=UPI0037F6A2BD